MRPPRRPGARRPVRARSNGRRAAGSVVRHADGTGTNGTTCATGGVTDGRTGGRGAGTPRTGPAHHPAAGRRSLAETPVSATGDHSTHRGIHRPVAGLRPAPTPSGRRRGSAHRTSEAPPGAGAGSPSHLRSGREMRLHYSARFISLPFRPALRHSSEDRPLYGERRLRAPLSCWMSLSPLPLRSVRSERNAGVDTPPRSV